MTRIYLYIRVSGSRGTKLKWLRCLRLKLSNVFLGSRPTVLGDRLILAADCSLG
jgi:hypothetical protein